MKSKDRLPFTVYPLPMIYKATFFLENKNGKSEKLIVMTTNFIKKAQ